MPCYDRPPYTIIGIDEQNSTVTLDMPNFPNIFPIFHTLVVLPYVENNTDLFLGHELNKNLPISMENNTEEYLI